MTIASIDIGTNTVLLLIAKVDIENLSIKTIFNEQKIPRIGEGLKRGKPIKESKQELLLQILRSYVETSKKFNSEVILANATNAFRIASNQTKLLNLIREIIGIDVNVISGLEEARLTFVGCTYEYSSAKKFAVIDIGGGSTEIITGNKNKICERFSLPIGVVYLTEKYFYTAPPQSNQVQSCNLFIKNKLDKNLSHLTRHETAIAVAGTPTTLACIKNNMNEYDESKIEGSVLLLSDVENLSAQLSHLSPKEIISKYHSVVSGREDVLLAGSILLAQIMRKLNTKEIVVSSKGVRYGAVVDYLFKNFMDWDFE